jgi:TPR repeat protein
MEIDMLSKFGLLVFTALVACSQKDSVQELEQQNTANSLNKLGEMYHFGESPVRQDLSKAYLYYLRATNKGSATAATHLGQMYSNGEGVVRSAEQAETWYQLSSMLDPSAENKCRNGHIEDKSFCDLLELAHRGDAEAQFVVGKRYIKGIQRENRWMLPPDKGKGVAWLKKAGYQGSPEACAWLYHLYKNGDGCEKDLEKAESWKHRALILGADTQLIDSLVF